MWTSGKTWETSLYEAYAFKKSSRNSNSVWVETLKTNLETKATTTSRVSRSLKHQKNPTIAKSPEVSHPVHLVWDSFPVVLYTLSDTSGLLKDQVKTSDQFWSIFQISRKRFCVSFKSAVELPQQQGPPFSLTCQFSKDHNPSKKIGNSSEVHQQLSYKHRNCPE